MEHFKDDFIYKIRSAIREAYVRRDELNRIIRSLDFGKDRYQFRIGRNRGRDGEFYDMFMDEALDIDPSTLSTSMNHQMNLFSMDHENKYGEPDERSDSTCSFRRRTLRRLSWRRPGGIWKSMQTTEPIFPLTCSRL